ncbi:MAG: LegC family aminotransferase [Candidatus Aminicenantes bacterium]|nr:LegC family aminotransferase [Candidatus Aminicenantes bacterium]
MPEFIPLSVPSIQGNEWKYVRECLDKEWVSSAGSYVDEFERRIADFSGARFAIACVNGTAALHIALKLAGVRRGDAVLVPTLTFIAPVNAIRYLDADPIFMDCDSFYNIDIEKTVEFIKSQTVFKNDATFDLTTGKKISAIVPVHVFGNAVDLDSLLDVCHERKIVAVEDATESLGTKYKAGRIAGKHAGTIGKLGCLSFNGNKIITTGGGGMILTDDPRYAEKAKYLTTQAKDDEIRYIHDEIGYNFRMTNVQAAIGVAQLENLEKYLSIKKRNYFQYKRPIDRIPGLHLAETPDYAENNHWMYALQIDKTVYRMDREQLMSLFDQQKIQTRPVWYLNHQQKPYRNCYGYQIEKAVFLHEVTLNIPCSIGLKTEGIERVISCLEKR